MRGKDSFPLLIPLALRITPAYAGKSDSEGGRYQQPRDHPRLCGEKCIAVVISNGILGSPPPMRGKAFGKICNNLFNRITPAYAGKRLIMYIMCGQIRDHPRLCGEKNPSCISSSACIRITPAYAGKSAVIPDDNQSYKDHPRLCGEKLSRKKVAGSGAGSPPPMRGKVILLNLLKICFRITPAYAGKSATK